jgi:outer membrane protein assembly factor BamA
MTLGAVVFCALASQSLSSPSVQAAVPLPSQTIEERVAAIRVRGNHTTPDGDVIALSGAHVGDAFTADTVAAVQRRLEKSGRFQSVDVFKRFDSLSDPSAIVLVIAVEERAGLSLDNPEPGRLRRLRANTMWLPILRYEDGYGFTYGARMSFVDVLGKRSRVSVPLSWGGERRATAEVERAFERGPLTRVRATGGVWRRDHPSLDIGDRREGATFLAERAVTSWFRIRGTGGLQSVQFGATDDTLRTVGFEATLDTRGDPAFPRNAVCASFGWDRLWFDHAADTSRLSTDVRGFLGVFGSSVLAVRVQQIRGANALPVFEQPMLGGTASLRGFPLGFRLGDRLAAGTLEIRVPVSSPRQVGRAGIAIFADSGATYDAHTTLDHAKFDTGVGAGWFLQLPVLSFRIDVAHGLGASTRAHVTLGVTF